MPKKFRWVNGYIVTENTKERTYSIYSKTGEFLATVNDGEVLNEIRELDRERGVD